MLLETLPLVLFIVLTELSIGSVGVLMFLDWRNEVKRGFLVSYAFIYLVLVGLTYLFQQGFATPQLLNTYKMLDHAWTGYQATPLLVFFLLLILYSVLLLVDRTAGIDAKKQEEQAKAEGVTVRPSIVRIVRLTAGALTVLAGLVTLFVMAMIYRPLGGSTFGGAFLVLGFFASAFALGGVMTSMWLGHWYLVTPALSERPLLFSTSVVLIAILAQIVFSVLAGPSTASAAKANIHTNSTSAAIVATTAASPAHKPAQVKPASNTPTVAPLSAGAIGWLRILVGFALPLVLGGLAWKLIRDRSFQSATGMLYLVVVLTLAGEIMGRGLFLIGLV
ncbi:MAG TPA: DmsC/YnfH family molybdoenzyme membrane anchor subunit [Ktedonobacteraceae bacterium]|jgi:DMSO reductase anchor subunit|nr:DmsC/YnfH family molybdoenzyme membrane anchor subunit [Ktedonobacteraceae bacterium]